MAHKSTRAIHRNHCSPLKLTHISCHLVGRQPDAQRWSAANNSLDSDKCSGDTLISNVRLFLSSILHLMSPYLKTSSNPTGLSSIRLGCLSASPKDSTTTLLFFLR